MARYTDSSCRLCRREGEKLFLKGERCYSGKCAVTRRQYAPGQHGQGRKKISDYGIHLREKQKAKRYYGLLESQFSKYFDMANKKQGVTGENLLQILESRFDNVIYRIGLASSRKEARQLVNHGHFTINGKKVNIPSYLVKVGEVISVREKSRDSSKIKDLMDGNGRAVPKWLDMDRNTMTAKVVALAERDDIDMSIQEHLIVEFYSK